jgi:hypothetical protein
MGIERIMIYEVPEWGKEDEPVPLLTVEGIYKDGVVELSEHPAQVKEAVRVLVIFLSSGSSQEIPPLSKGQDRETLRQQAFARMREGMHLDGPPYPKRQELYDRFKG